MSGRSARWLAWSLSGVYALTVAATSVLVASGAVSRYGILFVLGFGYGLVGSLIAIRKPGHAVGWLLLCAAVGSGVAVLAEGYAERGYAGEAAAALVAVVAIHAVMCVAAVFLPLVFPTGRLVSPAWRVALWTGGAGLLLITLSLSLDEFVHFVGPREPLPNPLAVHGPLADVVRLGYPVGFALEATAFVLAGASLVVRMRRSRGRERRQLKVFAYAVGMLTLAIVLVVLPVAPDPDVSGAVNSLAYAAAWLILLYGLPLAIGVAILRHRLYDIDHVINRTLVYGVLTVTLAVAYVALFLLLHKFLLSPFTRDSDLAVAVSTLAVASLSRPARARIQRLVDRRFYRARYDATRTVEQLAARLRGELELDAAADDLRHAVQAALQPTQVSLWLRRSP